MARITVVYWRDIPAQVISGRGRGAAKRVLADRFAEAIDRAAMNAGLAGSDDYLLHWRREAVEAVDAGAAAARLEAEYDMDRLRGLIGNGGAEV